jgi:hypothetical protein
MLSLYYKKENWLARDACFQAPISIRSYNLDGGKMKKVVGEIASYHHERD